MSDLISKRFIQDALIEKISNLNAEGETRTAKELIRLKKFVDGLTPSSEPKTKCIAQIKVDRDDIEDMVNKMVKEIAEPKTGEWIQISPARVYECSECGQNVMTNDIEAYKFCHNCGARMNKMRADDEYGQ